MFSIDEKTNVIRLTRGDYAMFSISILTADGNPYELQDGDTVRFTVKKNTKSSIPLIQKEGTVIEILHDDTKDLKYGTYTYDCELTHANGEPDTFIEPTEFELTPEVTW